MEGRLSARGDAPPPGGARRFCLRPSIELFPAGEGTCYLLRAGGDTLAVRDPSPADRELLLRLARGPVEVPPGDPLEERLRPLVDAGVVVAVAPSEPLPPAEAARFARQAPYLAEHGDPAALQRRLRAATVVVIGCGGVGTWTLGALASTGVGRFRLVDDDAVELSNLNRQVLYRAADVGRPKVALAADWLRAFDPAIEVDAQVRRVGGAADVAEVVAGADALVLAADWPPYELARWVNAACLAASVPWTTAGQQPPVLKLGPTYVPGSSACFACHETWLARAAPHYRELAEHRRRHPSDAATLGPASGILGCVLALELMHLLAGVGRPATEGRALLLDMRTLAATWEAVPRDPDCPGCGPPPGW